MGKPWRIAYSLDKESGLFAQVDARAPNRSHYGDGSIGDAAHQARTSDHNAWRRDSKGQPVVGAIDIAHDPKGGFDSYAFAKSLAKANDPRLKYIISNGQIYNPSVSKYWRKYNGENPHDRHVHVSVSDNEFLFDKKGPWQFDVQDIAADYSNEPAVMEDPFLRRGSKGDAVKVLQRLLGVTADGDFGPITERAVKAFQSSNKLVSDGKVGVYTWAALRAKD